MLRLTLASVCICATRACTTVLAGNKATTDGSTLLMHTDDCGECDFRLARVPPAATSSASPVLRFTSTYPREVSSRAATYATTNLDTRLPNALRDTWVSAEWMANQTLGVLEAFEPRVAEALGVPAADTTFGTLEGLYSIVNSEQVAIAESTATQSPLLLPKMRTPPAAGAPYGTSRDGALWDVAALTRVALARCPTARCAVDVMGHLAVRDGFYGSIAAECGEALLVADPHEAWVFHVVPLQRELANEAGVGDAYSAVWAAQRVPDEHFVVMANRFIIRDLVEQLPDESTTLTLACGGDAFRHSANLFAVAARLVQLAPDPFPRERLDASRLGVRPAPSDEGGGGAPARRLIDFLLVFGGDVAEIAYYTNDRVWRVLSLFAPDTPWEWPSPTPLASGVYPFSAAPSRKLGRDDVLAVARDVYRGAEHPSLDLTRGLAAGPWGDPSRSDALKLNSGSFPRAISMFRTSYSHVTEIGRRDGASPAARIWAAQGAPHAAMYTPLHVLPATVNVADAAAHHVHSLPPSFTRGSLHRADALDATPSESSVFWRTTLLNNWARAVGYDHAWDSIEQAQAADLSEATAAAEEAEAAAARAGSPEEAAAVLAAADTAAAARSAERHRALIVALMTRLHDGYNMAVDVAPIKLSKLFYPEWYLQRVGYYSKSWDVEPTQALLAAQPAQPARPEQAGQAERGGAGADEKRPSIAAIVALSALCGCAVGAVAAAVGLRAVGGRRRALQATAVTDDESDPAGLYRIWQ